MKILKKKKIIYFGKFDKYIVVLLIGGLTEFFKDWFASNTAFDSYSLLKSLANALGMAFAGVFVIYKKCRGVARKDSVSYSVQKKDNKENLNENGTEGEAADINNEIRVVQKKQKKYERKRMIIKYSLLFLNAFIDVVSTIILNLFTKGVKVHCILASILFISLFCFLLFKEKIYRHHLLCTLIITLLSLGHDFIADNFDGTDYHIIFKILFNILYGLNLTLMKFIMTNYFSPPYEACFWQGLFEVIIYIIPFIIYYKYPDYIISIRYGAPDPTKKPDNIYEYFNVHAELLDLLKFFAIVLFYFVYNMCVFMAMNHLTVCSYLIMNYFGEIPNFIKDNVSDGFESKNLYYLFEYLGILFFALVYNEVIELNILSLNKYTKINIQERGIKDADADNILDETNSFHEHTINQGD